MSQFERIGSHKIYFNERYYLAYAGGKRELSSTDQKEYNKIISLPFILQRKELSKISFDKNPNVIPLTGRQLLSFIKELHFVPLFDQFFEQSRLMQLTDVVVFESIRQKSYEIALREYES